MSTLLLERSPGLDEGFECDARLRLDGARFAGTADARGGLTLNDLITSVWEGLAVRGTVNCPVCQGQMAADIHEDSDDPPTGVCLDCGSRLG
jgi:hypothetical protein